MQEDGRNQNILMDILNDLNGMFYRCLHDEYWTMVFVTNGCKKLTGYTQDDLLNNKVLSYSDLVYSNDLEKVQKKCNEAISKKQPFIMEYRLVDKAGRIKNVWERASGVYDEYGNVKYIEGYITDISDQKDKEAINSELLLYRKAIDINTICSVTDMRGNIIYVNDRFCQVSKYTEAELLGANHRIINSGYHTPQFFEDMWLTIFKGNVWKGEIRNKAKNGSYYWVDTIIIPIQNEKGKIHQFLSLRTVITEKKKAEEQIYNYVQNMEKMLFMISHELRRPVATSMGLTNLLDPEISLQQGELQKILKGIQGNLLEIDLFTRKLTDFIHENKIEQRESINN